MTTGHATLNAGEIDAIEPACGGRFAAALYFAAEAHVVPLDALTFLLRAVRAAGAEVGLGVSWTDDRPADRLLIDCRGLAAQSDLHRTLERRPLHGRRDGHRKRGCAAAHRPVGP